MLQFWPFMFSSNHEHAQSQFKQAWHSPAALPYACEPLYLRSAQLQTKQSLIYRGLTCYGRYLKLPYLAHFLSSDMTASAAHAGAHRVISVHSAKAYVLQHPSQTCLG